MSDSPTPFDRRAVRMHRDRVAGDFADHAFLFEEVADRLADRLEDFSRRFPLALELGCRTGLIGPCLRGRGGVVDLVSVDFSPAMVARAPGLRAAADEEFLPFADNSFDLIVSPLALHWTNDLPGALIQARRALKPDGLLLAAVLGGATLADLRACLIEAEAIESGGARPRVSPTADVRDLGSLLQRAGFALPVVDTDTLTVTYANALALMRDLRGMGETHAGRDRTRHFTRRGVLLRAAALYQERYADTDGRIEANFEVLFATAWAPHVSQQQALRPGSAKASLAAALQASNSPSSG